MMKVKSFVFNPFMENTYVLYDDTKEAVIIDPGCYEGYEKEQLNDFIKTEGLSVVRLLNTHCHIDHVLGNHFVKKTYGVKLGIHATEEATLKSVQVYAPSYGFQHYEEAEVDEFIKEGEDITFGNTRLAVLFVPGHAPGHVAFYNRDDKIMIGGDVLFNGSIGRTDLPGGDFNTLIKSIHEKIFPLPEEVIIYCGHGDSTTIGKEKKTNPFCALV